MHSFLAKPSTTVALTLALVALAAPAGAHAAGSADAKALALSARCPNAQVVPGQATPDAVQTGTLCLMNAQRTARGLRALKLQPTLGTAASAFAGQMVTQQFFDHTSPTGATVLSRIKATSYLRHAFDWMLGENIAWGSGSLSTPGAIVDAWMHSPGHRANLLDRNFSDVGIGIVQGAPIALGDGELGGTYVTDFGRRRRA
jgi:uncharacterized protein YkwD